jgi:hypothetical protein
MAKRGIIITSPFTFDGKALTAPYSGIEPVFLRQCLLFWDRIDWPDNNIISLGTVTPEIQFLIESKIMIRTRVSISGTIGNIGHALLIMQEAAFEVHNNTEPGLWSLAQEGPNLVLPMKSFTDRKTIEIELYNYIPVPDKIVSLEDILNFKEKRRDELLSFRSLMDSLYAEIVNSKDVPRSKVAVIEKLQISIADLHRVMKESLIKRCLSTLKVELNLSDLLKDTLLTGTATKIAFGISPEIAAIIGFSTSAIKIGWKIVPFGKRVPPNLRDYAYLYHLERELP